MAKKQSSVKKTSSIKNIQKIPTYFWNILTRVILLVWGALYAITACLSMLFVLGMIIIGNMPNGYIDVKYTELFIGFMLLGMSLLSFKTSRTIANLNRDSLFASIIIFFNMAQLSFFFKNGMMNEILQWALTIVSIAMALYLFMQRSKFNKSATYNLTIYSLTLSVLLIVSSFMRDYLSSIY